jgi:hypothetical protein
MALAGNFLQVLVDGYELTADHNEVSIDDNRKLLEATSFGMSAERYIAGQRSMSLSHKGFLNPEAAAAHPVLKGIAVQGVVSVWLGQNADPDLGDPVYNLLTQQEFYTTKAEVGQVIPFNAKFANRGDLGGWGQALAVPVSITNSFTGSAVDNGASSAKGGAAFLHILEETTSDSYLIEVEGSADGVSAWGQLAEFDADGMVLSSERQAVAGSIPRYLRVKLTRFGTAGDSLRFAISMVRF